MTDIDPQADLEVHFVGELMTVRLPLAGPVTGEWLQHYQKLALAAQVRVQGETHHDRAWIIVTVPARSDQGEVAATLDAARTLMAEADAADRPPASVKAEASVRDWWARSRESAPRMSASGVEAAGEVNGTRNELAQTRTALADDRTILASERSLLAWYRTAFGAYALSLGFGAVLPSLRKISPALGDLYVVAGICFALLGAGFAVDGFLRYRRFAHTLNISFPSHQHSSEMVRLTLAGVAIAVLGVATALIVAIDRFA